MIWRPDGERAAAWTVFLISVALVGGALVEYASLLARGTDVGVALAGLLIVAYGIGVAVTLLGRPGSPGSEPGNRSPE